METLSLSWFKKRTAVINKLLQTTAKRARTKKGKQIVTYSPLEEYKAYRRALERGETTRFVEQYRQDPRGAIGKETYTEGLAARQSLADVWGALATANYKVSALVTLAGEPNIYIDGDGRLWRFLGIDTAVGKIMYTPIYWATPELRRTSEAKEEDDIRPPLRRLTASIANREISKTAKEINQRKSGSASAGGTGTSPYAYQDVE